MGLRSWNTRPFAVEKRRAGNNRRLRGFLPEVAMMQATQARQ